MDGDKDQLKISLLTVYYQNARDELNSRIGHRDNVLLLFLGTWAAIFGIAFGNISRPVILFAVAPLGLGASLIIAQHNDLIGAIAEYCGIEVSKQAKRIIGDGCPYPWDTSSAMIEIGPRRLKSPEGLAEKAVPRVLADRLYASLLLVAGPGIAGWIVAFVSTDNWWVRIAGSTVDLIATLWIIFLLWNTFSTRRQRRQKLSAWIRMQCKAPNKPFYGVRTS